MMEEQSDVKYPADELHHDECEYRELRFNYQELLEMMAFSRLSREELRQAALEEMRRLRNDDTG